MKDISLYDEPVEIRLARAKSLKTSKEELVLLSQDSFWYIRDYVATNVNTPIPCLLELLNDPDFRVQTNVKNNETYKQWLIKDTEEMVLFKQQNDMLPIINKESLNELIIFSHQFIDTSNQLYDLALLSNHSVYVKENKYPFMKTFDNESDAVKFYLYKRHQLADKYKEINQSITIEDMYLFDVEHRRYSTKEYVDFYCYRSYLDENKVSDLDTRINQFKEQAANQKDNSDIEIIHYDYIK